MFLLSEWQFRCLVEESRSQISGTATLKCMWSSRSAELLTPNPEPEQTLRRLLRERRAHDLIAMENIIVDTKQKKALMNYFVPSWSVATSCIRTPRIKANNFELKHGLIQMIQSSYSFGGLPSEDPNEHILRFMEVCNTKKYNGVSNETLRLMLFLFSLTKKLERGWILYLEIQLQLGRNLCLSS